MLRGSLSVALLLVVGSMLLEGSVLSSFGYYKGGTVFWEAHPDNSRKITVYFEFSFDSRRYSDTHYQCTDESIRTHEELRTGGQYVVGNNKKFANYICVKLDEVTHTATGVYSFEYTLPAGETTANISYKECCWIPDILNNAKVITGGKGWNLASTINIAHGDGVSINSPPQSKTFAKYSIISGCTYSIYIANDDANNDVVKCRWTNEDENECNPGAGDICGQPYHDKDNKHPVARLKKQTCELRFKEEENVPVGTYAFMVMLEDFASNQPKRPMSKTPVHFLVDVFNYEGECRQPSLHVPRMCFAHVLGEEFRMRMVATATAPQYRITSIDVQGYPTDAPNKVPGTDSDYDVTFSFIPSMLKTYTICAFATEDERFISSHSCFTVNVVQTEPAALRVDGDNSNPADGDQEAEATVNTWAIKFNRKIRKGVFSPAYVTLHDSKNAVVWRVDATGPDAAIVGDETLTFPKSDSVFLDVKATYTISLDEGVVQSVDGKCSVKSKPFEWSFVTAAPEPAVVIREPVCSISSMTMFLPKLLMDLGGHGPEIMHLRDPQCTGTNYNETHYYVWTSYGLCGTTYKHNGTDYKYSNVIYIPEARYSPAGTKVTRVPHREILFSCNIPVKTIKTLTFDPYPGTIKHQEFEGRADFLDHLTGTTLRLFNNADYDQLYDELPIVPFDTRLYFEGEASCYGNRQCDTFFQSCWATTSENPYSWPRHELIKGGCVRDSTLTMYETGVSNKVRFSVDAFAFLGWRILDTVWVHCNVFVCPTSDIASICKQGCRQTRSLTIDDRVSSRDFISVVSSPGLVRQK